MKRIIIIGSSRSDGNTHQVVQKLYSFFEFDVIDLKDYKIGHYDYEYKNKNDDFLPLLKNVLKYEQIIFATPIYWYAMSGIMKVFFDRLTDCLTIEKKSGIQLRGKSMSVISCSDTDYIIDGFFIPFEESAKYLNMAFIAKLHTFLTDEKLSEKLKTFAESHA